MLLFFFSFALFQLVYIYIYIHSTVPAQASGKHSGQHGANLNHLDLEHVNHHEYAL